MEVLTDEDRKRLSKAFASHAVDCKTCMTTVLVGAMTGKDRRDTEAQLCVVGRALGAAYPLGKGGAQ